MENKILKILQLTKPVSSPIYLKAHY